MATHTIDSVTSIFTQKELDLFCSTFNIPADLRTELPGPNDTIRDSPEGKIGIYTRFIKFANFHIPLSKFLLFVLEYYQINFSQLSIAAIKISHFEIMCRVHESIPTIGTFRRFYCNSITNGWLSFSKRSGVGTPCCYSKNLDSLKNWNNHFFWIDASVCPISVPWFEGVSVKKDPLPSDEVVDLPLVERLNESRTLIRKYPEKRLKKHVDYEQFIEVLAMDKSMLEEELRATKSKLKLYDRMVMQAANESKLQMQVANAEWLCKLQAANCMQMQASCKLQMVCKCKQAGSASNCKLQMVCNLKLQVQANASCKMQMQASNANANVKANRTASFVAVSIFTPNVLLRIASQVLAFASLSTQFVIGTRLLTMRVLGDALAFDPDALAFNPDALAFDLDG
ncbi:hypothetical protein Tco_0476334 [Tanacetum coccineum]